MSKNEKQDTEPDTHVEHVPEGTPVVEAERESNDEPREAFYERITGVRVQGE